MAQCKYGKLWVHTDDTSPAATLLRPVRPKVLVSCSTPS
jgi:hypothetical protein